MATILRPDGSSQEVQPKDGTGFQLKELQDIVGGYIEMLRDGSGDLVDPLPWTEKPEEVQSSLLPCFLTGVHTAHLPLDMAVREAKKTIEQYQVRHP
jgi:hypothetical protein